jgi:cyclophilin family peptidyl-prolyl cis-trans isomerase
MPRLALGLVLVVLLSASAWAQAPAPAAPAGPVVVVETSRGVFEFETFPAEAPKTVARILELVKTRFYNGMRIHRVVPGFVIQMGDPQTRDMTKRDKWKRRQRQGDWGGRFSKKRAPGAVAIAYAGTDATQTDSQFTSRSPPRPDSTASARCLAMSSPARPWRDRRGRRAQEDDVERHRRGQ